MKTSIKHLPRIEEILPGALTLGLLIVAYHTRHPDFIKNNITNDSVRLLAASGVVLLASWIVGAFLDSVRDIFEEIMKKWLPLNLDFFFYGEPTKVQQFDEYYFAYYSLCFNLAIGTALFLLLQLPNTTWLGRLPGWSLLLLFIIFAIFAVDAWILRQNVRNLIGYSRKTIPHMYSYTRLQYSDTHGVGVLAIRDIPEGTSIFRDDPAQMIVIDKKEIDVINPEFKDLYNDFCVRKSDKYLCPRSFNRLTVSWYINDEKENPNVRCTGDPDYHFIATRYINKGEELLVDYSKYSDNPEEA